MKQEVQVALEFLTLHTQRYGSIKDQSFAAFRSQLEKTLLDRYEGHWYPDKPIKGQAYRSLDFNKENDYCDAVVSKVCASVGFAPSLLGIRHELTVWIDPREVTIRVGSHVFPKDHQHHVLARFDHNGNKCYQGDLDTILKANTTLHPSVESVSNYPASLSPPRVLSPIPCSQPSMFHNGPLFIPPRTLSPKAPVFQMSTPIDVPFQSHPLENNIDSTEESSSVEDNRSQPERSDTPHSMHSTTSNESTDSGYCGYVESYPYYYKLNRLNKALALQKSSINRQLMGKTHSRRPPRNAYHHYHPETLMQSASPPTPTPLNIDQLAPFFGQQVYFPMPTVVDGGKMKY